MTLDELKRRQEKRRSQQTQGEPIMTLDRTKKYKVGDVVFVHQDTGVKRPWKGDFPGTVIYLNDDELLKMHPVEVEEPLKWSFEWDAESSPLTIGQALHEASPGEVHEHHWRHEVVSTRIG